MTAADDLDTLLTRAQHWISDDPDPVTGAELAILLTDAESGTAEERAAATAELEDRFRGLLQFGTAGLRGALGGGPNRMNRAVVIRTAAGLAAFLQESLPGVGAGAQRPRVVIGYDARRNSDVFAHDTAAVMTAAGVAAFLLPRALPTPVLAFAVQHLAADAGVMVTASHNPPQDNGYKVYLGGRVVTGSGQGAQIVPPVDAQIAAHIASVPSVAAVPRAEGGWTVLGANIEQSYVETVARLADPGSPRDLRIVLTPLHGVGGAVVETVLHRVGFTDVHLVPEQAEPDPAFPTVSFPNPEEPGAIDLAIALARTLGADLVLANDPDADRCAVAVRDRYAEGDGWRMLHGDEVGALLGEDLAAGLARPGAAASGEPPVLASSIVSSRLLGRIAAAHGLRHTVTPTGFKWLSRVDGLAYAYEEALGYCVDPAQVRDKDGISAALVVAQLAARLKAQGRTLVDALDDLARVHGLYLSGQVSARFTDLAEIPATMQRLRSAPHASLAGSPVTEFRDLSEGSPELPATDGLLLLAQDGTRVIIRPSGTEPKVKCYLEVIAEVGKADLGSVRAAARARLGALSTEIAALLAVT